MFARLKREERKPSYPSPARQWQGLITIVVCIVLIEFVSSNFGRMRNPAGLLALAAMFVTHWSGLRTGLVCAAVIFCYLLTDYSNPGTILEYTPANVKRLISAAIGLPFYVLLVGVIGGKLRKARIREFDARERANQEEEQRLTAEAQLQSSEEMRRLVIDSAMDAIVVYDANGRITLWNPSATHKFGWTPEEAEGHSFESVVLPDRYREVYAKSVSQLLEEGTVQDGNRLEATGVAKDGREFPIEVSIAPHVAPQGTSLIVFIRDMTEQKKLNDRLRQAQKMEAIGTLAGGIAHDFNNVLAAISGNIALAKEDTPRDSPASVSLAEVEKSVQKAVYIVRQILTFSRAGDSDVKTMDIAPVLEDATRLLRATISATMEVSLHAPKGLPAVSVDATDIHQMVLNLGINAFHALEGRNGTFEIWVTQIDLDPETAKSLMNLAPGRYVRLSFGDNGCGINEETMQRIFEPFFTTKDVGEGTGLGLAVVYGIVARHGGAIFPYSELGKGTVFHVYLPSVKSKAPVPDMPSTIPVAGKGERILYVDDDEALVFMMKRMLGRLNYNVVGFTDPSEALSVFQSDPGAFDLAITDMSMPHINGPALVKKMQDIRTDMPIIMVTGYIRPDDLEQARHLGIQELVLKPNTAAEMSEVLHRILEHRLPLPS